MSDNKKQMMDIQKVKSLSVAVSDEHQRNWGDDLFQGRRMIQSTTMTVVVPDLTFRCRKVENLDLLISQNQ